MPVAKRPVVTRAPVDQPPLIYQEEAWSLKALATGTASEAEQGLVVRFIMEKLTEYGGMPYRSGSDRDTSFAEGKRFVGWFLANVWKMTPEQITQLPRFGAAASEDDGSIANI